MLVLTRKPREQIRINHTIELTVLEIVGGRAKLGFTCPPEIPIVREEIYRRLIAEQEQDSEHRPPMPGARRERPVRTGSYVSQEDGRRVYVVKLKKGQPVSVGDGVELRVLENAEGQVTLSVSLPAEEPAVAEPAAAMAP
jgi:carbon storage regulator